MIAGVDGATRNLGAAFPNGELATLNARAGAEDPVRRLAELERGLWTSLRRHPPIPALVVVEGYALGTPGRLALVRLGEVGGMIRTVAFRLGAEVVEISPSALKRYATGNGNAKKPQMIAAALDLDARLSKADAHDEADAFLLRHLGRAAYGLEHVDEDYRREVLGSISWPVIEALR